MTSLLEEAIEHLRELPEDKQDAAADALFAYIANDERHYQLSPRQAEDIRRIQRNLVSGTTRFATDEEADDAWTKAGL